MNNKGLIFLVYIFGIFLNSFAQEKRNCGQSQYNQNLISKRPNFRNYDSIFERNIQNIQRSQRVSNNQKITIPVVVHIVHNNKNGTIGGLNNSNITDELVYSQIQVLNEDYRMKKGTKGESNDPNAADSQIEFCLASTDPNCNPTTGITRFYYNKSEYNLYSDDALLKSFDYWPSDEYLNIWVCNLSKDVLGYAQFPSYTGLSGLNPFEGASSTDGVVISYRTFGKNPPVNSSGKFIYGRTTTHEIGHWLGLKHVWGDEDCGDDYCNDTRKQDKYSVDNIVCVNQYSFCDSIKVLKNSNNYLDYSADNCMNTFTNDQKNRMWAVLNTSTARKKLFNSKGCLATSIQDVPFEYSAGNFSKIITNGWDSTRLLLSNDLNIKNLGTISSPILKLNSLENPFLKISLKANLGDSLIINTIANCGSTVNFFKSIYINYNSDTTLLINLSSLKKLPQVQISAKVKSKDVFTVSRLAVLDITQWPFVSIDGNLRIGSDLLFLYQKVDWTIYDFTGKKIITKNVNYAGTDDYIFDLNTLSNGMYIAKYEVNGNVKYQKFLIYK